MDRVLSNFKQTIKDFNKDNWDKGYKVKGCFWNKTNFDALCQIVVTCIPDCYQREILFLDQFLDTQDETIYVIDVKTSFYNVS